MTLKVSLIFDDSDLEVAKKIFEGLVERDVEVYCSHKELNHLDRSWGKTHQELVEFLYSEDINFCIVLLSSPFVSRLKQRNHQSFYLIEAALSRNNFLLPIQLNRPLENLPPYLSRFFAPIFPVEDFQKIIDLFFAKIANYEGALQDLSEYEDAHSVICSYDSKFNPESISGKIKLSERGIGFELFKVNDDFAVEYSKYFLFLYAGTAVKNAAEYIRDTYPEAFRSKALIILMPKERGQKIYAARKTNVSEAFQCNNVFYLDEFLWTYCTKNRILKGLDPFPVQQFIDPFFEGHQKKALEYLYAWWTMPHEPILVVKGGGGFGKSTLVKQFSNQLITRPNSTVLYFESSEVTRSIRKSMDWYEKLDLYAIYKAFCNLRKEQSIDPELFKLNLDNGNITVVVDGIDEILARLPSAFDLNAFVRSIYDATSKVGDGKVILTCRNFFWDQTNPDFQFDTVELRPFTRKLAEEYFQKEFPGFQNLPQRAMLMADSLNRGQHADCYIPFVLDIISNLLRGQIDNDDGIDPEFSSEILNERISNDYILFKFCNREIAKLAADISVDDQVRIFVDFAVRKGSSILRERAKEFFEATLRRDIDTVAATALMAHPFFAIHDSHLKFRYDFFEEHFNNIYVSGLMVGRESVDETSLRLMRRYYKINSIFMQDCVSRINPLSDDVQFGMLSLLDQIRLLFSSRVDLEEVKVKATAMIFNVALQSLVSAQRNCVDENTKMLKTFFLPDSNSPVTDMSLCGITYNNSQRIVFDFSDLVFQDCYFEEYDFFWECRFSKRTLFQRSKFLALGKKADVNSKALLANFELQSCYLDEHCFEIAKGAKEKQKSENVQAVEDLRGFLQFFSGHGTFSKRRQEETLKGLRGLPNLSLKKLLKILTKEGVVIQVPERVKVTYEIPQDQRHDVDQFVAQGIMTPSIKRVWKALREI